MQIYYINLARRTDRRTFMETQFSALGLSATRIEASTPADIPPADLHRYCDPRRPGAIPPIHFACSLSHLAALSHLLAGSADYALVLEDDVILSTRLPAFLAEFESHRQPFDILRLETTLQGVRLKGNSAEIAGIGIARPYSWENGSGGYLISRRAADTVIRIGATKRHNIDMVLFHPFGRLARRFGLAQAVPALCCQTSETPAPPTRLASDIRSALRAAAPVPLRPVSQFWSGLTTTLRRELLLGGQQTFHQLLGAKKQVIPFLE